MPIRLKSSNVLYNATNILVFLFLSFLSAGAQAQKPKDGTYTFAIAFAEWQDRSLGATCTVVIRGDSVTVLHNGSKGLSGKKGDVLDKGILVKHARTGQWIIAHDAKDRYAKEVGGCTDGPAVLDFRRKKYSIC